MLENALTNTPLVTACHLLFTYHCQLLLERARVIFAGKSKIMEVVVHGGGSRGGPVASFTRTTSRHSSLQRQAPCAYPQSHAVGTDQCAIFRIVATVIDYFSLLVTACHRLFTYHCPRWKERASSRTIRWKERASSQSRKHVFHPDEFTFMGHRSKFIWERAHAASVTYAHTHTDTTNCKYRYPITHESNDTWILVEVPPLVWHKHAITDECCTLVCINKWWILHAYSCSIRASKRHQPACRTAT